MGKKKRNTCRSENFHFEKSNEILYSAWRRREHVATVLFCGYSFNVPLQKYGQLRRNPSGNACHHGCITKFIKEGLVVSSLQVRAIGPSNIGNSQITTIMPSMDHLTLRGKAR